MKNSTLTEDKAEKTPTGGVLVGKRQGQTIIHNKGTLSGYLVGKTHAEGGIKAINKSTGQPLEMQGGEVVITAPAVSDNTKNEFNGKMMTNREILSTINEKGGGVAFAKGGDIPKNIKRTGASYKYGGKTMTDHEIYKHITGGHLAEGMTLSKIAKKHKVSLKELQKQVDMGMKAESEHTSSKREQMKIVKDHLFENPKYYTLLKKFGLEDGGEVEDNFKKWFNGSKVVDKKGNPLVVYHGSPDLRGLKSDYIFKTSNERYGISNENRAYFFTDSYSIAKSYADPRRAFDYQNSEEGVMQLYLSLKNPLIVDANNQIWRKFETEINKEKIVGTRNLISYAQSKNYDGVIVKNVRDYYTNNENKKTGGNVYVAFEPEQIKLADGTNTTFDANNPDIRYNNGGRVHRGSLVRDAKSGNTPARDLNNYNDVMDLEADGMVGGNTGLFDDGGSVKELVEYITIGNQSSNPFMDIEKVRFYNFNDFKDFVGGLYKTTGATNKRELFICINNDDSTAKVSTSISKGKNTNSNFNPSTGTFQDLEKNFKKHYPSRFDSFDWSKWSGVKTTTTTPSQTSVPITPDADSVIAIMIYNEDKTFIEGADTVYKLLDILVQAQKDGIYKFFRKYVFEDNNIYQGFYISWIENNPSVNGDINPSATSPTELKEWLRKQTDLNSKPFNLDYFFSKSISATASATATPIATATPTSTPIDLTKTKIWIGNNPALSEKIQKRVMELGWDWWSGDKKPKFLDYTNLFFDINNKITSASDETNFDSFKDFREIDEADLFGTYTTPTSTASQTSTQNAPVEDEDWVKKFTADLDKLSTYLPNDMDFAPELSKERKDLNALIKLLPSFQQSKYAIERAKILKEIKKLHYKLTYEGFIKPNEATSSDADLFTPQGLLDYYFTQATQNPTAELEPACELPTPNGEKSKLPMSAYLNVRTEQFKNWFGDWEKAYENGNYVNCSKMIDPDTKEPKIYFHGVRKYVPNFGQFSNMGQGVVRPYGAFEPPTFPASYFAGEEDYAKFYGGVAENLPTPSADYKPFIYKVFLSVKNPISLLPLDFMLSYKDFMDYIYVAYGVKVEPNQELLKLIDNDLIKKHPMWFYVRRDIGFIEKIKDYGYDALFQIGDIPTFLPDGTVEPDRTKHLQEVEYLTFYPNQVKSATVKKSFYFDFFNDIRFKNGGYVRI